MNNFVERQMITLSLLSKVIYYLIDFEVLYLNIFIRYLVSLVIMAHL